MSDIRRFDGPLFSPDNVRDLIRRIDNLREPNSRAILYDLLDRMTYLENEINDLRSRAWQNKVWFTIKERDDMEDAGMDFDAEFR